MKKLFALITAVVMLSALGTAAQATLLTFDEIGTPGGVFPGTNGGFNYQGYHFSATTDVVDIGPGSPVSDGGPTLSGSYAALNNYYGPLAITRTNNQSFSLLDVYLRSYATGDLDASITGYSNGNQLYQLFFQAGNYWQDIQANFADVDLIVFDSVSSNPDFNNFLIDDLNLVASAAPVPEPSSFLLIGGGLAVLSLWRRRSSGSC
jgi:hypothetical protein